MAGKPAFLERTNGTVLVQFEVVDTPLLNHKLGDCVTVKVFIRRH
jgi:hypothetical protein